MVEDRKMSDLARFNKFLSEIDIDSLRGQYQKIKTVELDMPKEILPLESIYSEYWEKRNNWVGYEEFYKIYKKSLENELEDWRKDSYFSEETFYFGLPARIYRIWASLLTQIQGGYVAEKIYGKGKVIMNAELDIKGIDMKVKTDHKKTIQIQVKKISNRNVARRSTSNKNKTVNLLYDVPGEKYTQRGTIRVPYQRWEKKWGDKLKVLGNGFVVFKKAAFEKKHLIELQSSNPSD